MSRAQDGHSRPAFHFGSTLRTMFSKGSSMPSELVDVQKKFENSFSSRVQRLMPAGTDELFHLTWMICAIETLSAIYSDVENLITAVDLPVGNWKDKCIQVYFDDTTKLLDISNSLISQIHMLEQSQRYLVCALQHLSKGTPEGFCNARASLAQWMELVSLKDQSLQQCCAVFDGFLQTPDLPKTSDKEKVLIQALNGFKAVTLFICSVFTAVFSGSAEKLTDVKVPNVYSWAGAFDDLQTAVNTKVRNVWSSGKAVVLKEVKAISEGVNEVYPVLQDGVGCSEAVGLVDTTADLRQSAEEFSQGLELLSKEVDCFFKKLISRRNALTDRLMVVAFRPEKGDKNKNV